MHAVFHAGKEALGAVEAFVGFGELLNSAE
jgi:hypothetical protein